MAASKPSTSPSPQVSARAETPPARKRPAVDLSLVDARLDELFAAPNGDATAKKLSARADSPNQNNPFRMLSPAQITVRPQVRQSFPPDELAELSASIRELRAQKGGIEGSGILQALLVSPEGSTEGEGFRLVAGERRFRASQSEGVELLPCLSVATASESAIRLLQLTENSVRTPPPILEEARAIHAAMSEDKLSIRDMARLLGKDKSYVEARVGLLKYPPDVQEMVSARADTLRHARHMAGVQDEELRRALIVAVRDEGIGEREVKRRIESAATGSKEGSTENAEDPGAASSNAASSNPTSSNPTNSGATNEDRSARSAEEQIPQSRSSQNGQSEAPSLRGAIRATGAAIEGLRRAVLGDEERRKAREGRDTLRAMLDELDEILG